MLRPLVLQQLLDTIVTPDPRSASSSSSSPSLFNGHSETRPHTALVVLIETGTVYAASSRYLAVTSSSSSSGTDTGTGTATRMTTTGNRPHPAFAGLLCPDTSSIHGHLHPGNTEERNRAIAVLACLAWRDKITTVTGSTTGNTSRTLHRAGAGAGAAGEGIAVNIHRETQDPDAESERVKALTFTSPLYGLLHVRPLIPSTPISRRERMRGRREGSGSFASSTAPASQHPSTSTSPTYQLPMTTSRGGGIAGGGGGSESISSLGPSPTSLLQRQPEENDDDDDQEVEDGDDNDDEDVEGGATLLLVLNSDPITTTRHGTVSADADADADADAASDSMTTMEQRGAQGAHLQALGQSVAISLAPSLTRLERC